MVIDSPADVMTAGTERKRTAGDKDLRRVVLYYQ